MVSEGQSAPEHENAKAPANEFGQGVGALLHASRMRCAENIDDVARMLRIRAVHLEAIEEGRYDDLPGPTYALGFVRAYAEHLGLDSAEVVRRYKQEISTVAKTSDLVFPSPIPEGGVPGGAILLVGVVVALVAYGGWYVSTSENRFFTEVISPLPERLAALFSGAEPAPPEAAAPAPPSSLSATAGETVEETPAGASPAPPAAEVPRVTGAPAAAPPSDFRAAPEASAVAPAEALVAAPAEAPVAAPPAVAVAVTAPAAATVAASAGEETTAAETPAAPPSADSSRDAEVENDAPPTEPAAAETGGDAAAPGDAAAGESGAPQQAEVAPAGESGTESAAATSAGAESAALAPAEAAPETPIERPVETPVETPVEAPIETPVETPVEAPLEAAPGVAPSAPPAQPAAGAAPRIVVRAKTASWIQVRDSVANQLLLTRLLRAGDTYEVPDRAGLQLLTGNAGALEILVDGEAVPAIGPVGAVRRSVALDGERLREGTASGE